MRLLRDDYPLQRGPWRIKALPETLEGEKRQMLIGDEIIAQPLYRGQELDWSWFANTNSVVFASATLTVDGKFTPGADRPP